MTPRCHAAIQGVLPCRTWVLSAYNNRERKPTNRYGLYGDQPIYNEMETNSNRAGERSDKGGTTRHDRTACTSAGPSGHPTYSDLGGRPYQRNQWTIEKADQRGQRGAKGGTARHDRTACTSAGLSGHPTYSDLGGGPYQRNQWTIEKADQRGQGGAKGGTTRHDRTACTSAGLSGHPTYSDLGGGPYRRNQWRKKTNQ